MTEKDTLKDFTLPVKFNKETRNLSLEEAAALAQKGLKFEAIEKDYGILKALSLKQNKSVPLFLQDLMHSMNEAQREKLTQECGGNEEMAEHILKLESNSLQPGSLGEVTESFPQIKSEDDLPQEVVEASSLRGTLLLDEYLRYLLLQNKKSKDTAKKLKDSERLTTGSLGSKQSLQNPETEGFLKGLWS